MTNPFEELAARMDQRMDRIEALLLERDSRRPEPVLVETEDLLSVGQAGQLLNMTTGSIYQLVHHGKIPYMKRGKKLYFSQKELRSWIQAGRHQTIDEIRNEAIKSLHAEKSARRTG